MAEPLLNYRTQNTTLLNRDYETQNATVLLNYETQNATTEAPLFDAPRRPESSNDYYM
jgi:hypothetical protein